jgi:hypothetical protein
MGEHSLYTEVLLPQPRSSYVMSIRTPNTVTVCTVHSNNQAGGVLISRSNYRKREEAGPQSLISAFRANLIRPVRVSKNQKCLMLKNIEEKLTL